MSTNLLLKKKILPFPFPWTTNSKTAKCNGKGSVVLPIIRALQSNCWILKVHFLPFFSVAVSCNV